MVDPLWGQLMATPSDARGVGADWASRAEAWLERQAGRDAARQKALEETAQRFRRERLWGKRNPQDGEDAAKSGEPPAQIPFKPVLCPKMQHTEMGMASCFGVICAQPYFGCNSCVKVLRM